VSGSVDARAQARDHKGLDVPARRAMLGIGNTGLSPEGRADMTGSSLTPFIVPIVAMICLAFLLGVVYYADSHPEWKRPGQEPGHTITGQASSSAVTSPTGSGELTDEPRSA
jgi:hypothetical protein